MSLRSAPQHTTPLSTIQHPVAEWTPVSMGQQPSPCTNLCPERDPKIQTCAAAKPTAPDGR
eukprot:CAMPEP_0174325012 /NCGR_PEP_ID=MMETSP0810-20121108/12932_1 /TAXON_ID=73025 ORGANISM="Eutreptiella gymnastica-like, Strain CCMP1594" /NCGR_SAMPLE_ID=MMETSP0810 /ASSEMBLY_ACC=CAM_ASM_000659 /LENGTH=60 /DNA_ID=CAMNT_0015438115 /DNA_START=682 /DNA_END=864 /DNA_ORIENTATION=+